jgi:hypothetical protein
MVHKMIFILVLCVAPIGLGRRTLNLNNQPSDFAIYLLRDDTLQTWQAKQLPLDALDLSTWPLVSINDIESYTWSDHTMRLNAEGVAKFKALENKTNSSRGFPFVVMVGNRKIYMGNIFRMYSSYMAGDLPYIFAPIDKNIKIARAPNKSIKDSRDDPRINNALARRNKLK